MTRRASTIGFASPASASSGSIAAALALKADLLNGVVPVTQLPPYPPQAQIGQGTFLAAGGDVAYSSGLSFRVSAGSAYINFVLVPFAAALVTIGTADITNPRIDAIVVSNAGALSVVAGTAAATPATPDTDSLTQLVLSYVLVPANASSLAITLTNLYLENTEWTSSVSGASVVANSTTNPFAGTKDIEFTAAASGAYVRLTNGSAISLSTAKQLVFQIRSKAAWANPKSVLVTWYSGTTKVGQSATLSQGKYGFASETTTGYQQIVIPIIAFGVPAGTTVDRLEFKVNGGGAAIGFYLDNVVLESTSTVETPAAQAIKESDLPISPWVALTDGATITWDVSGKREAKATVTLGGSRTLAIVGAVNGSAGEIRVTQGSGGQGLTLPAGSKIVGGGGTTAPLSTGAGVIDILGFEYDGTTFLWTVGKAAS